VWTIDPGHSAAQFSVRHMVVSNVKGEFDGPAGTVTFDPKDPTTLRVEATIDARSINTRNPDRDKDLRSELFFDIAKYPRITFKSRSTSVAGPGKLKVAGDLTMHGVTKPVVLDVEGPTEVIKDIWGSSRVGATATTTLDRRDFGLVYSRVLEAGGAVVGDQVSISIDLEMTTKK
jgi:polyisoprenoid-binding protein YceI